MKVQVEDLIVYLTAAVKEKIELWTTMARGEVSGLGIVEEMNEGSYRGYKVTDLYLAEQSCNGSGTVITPESAAKLMIELETRGIDTGKLKFWWHSHGDIGVMWSGTDEENIQGFKPKDYFISLVTNKKGKSLCRVDVFKPIRLCVDEVRMDLILPDMGLEEECKKEFAARVTEKSYLCEPYKPLDPKRREEISRLSEEEITNMLCTGEIDWWEVEEVQNEELMEGGYFDDF